MKDKAVGKPVKQRDEDALVEKITTQLDAQAQALDAATQSALNQARAAAMAAVAKTDAVGASESSRFAWQWPALAAAAALALVVVYPGLQPADTGVSEAAVAQLKEAAGEDGQLIDDEALALLNTISDDDFEFYADLEFIQWLDEQQQMAEGGDSGQAHQYVPGADANHVS